MNWQAYSSEVPGKWVLCGEHTVLRGGAAIALPHPELRMRMEFRPGGSSLSIEPKAANDVVTALLEVAGQWLATKQVEFDLPHGSLRFQSSIPFGAGFGSSAALSVSLARWVLAAASLDRAMERELARTLEDRLHGRSSGMDVAVVSIGEPILFSLKGGARSLGLQHLPDFRFFDTGLRASTKDCIERVEALRSSDPGLSDRLDSQMAECTKLALEGLRAYDQAFERGDSEGRRGAIACIGEAMTRTREVYLGWGLQPDGLESAFSPVTDGEKRGGASDDSKWYWRLTGAGCGGFVVGLERNV